jgi:predicted Zn finger-like uncharacterized protein
MALAAICPHCHTTFRVAADQLKLRGGIVRCGACNEVFDGNAVLVDLDAIPLQDNGAAAAAAAAPPPASQDDEAAAAALGPLPVLDSVVEEPAAPEPEAEAEPEPAPEPAPVSAPAYILDFDTTLDEAAAVPVEEHLEALPPPDDGDADPAPPAPLTPLDPAAVDSLAPLLQRASAAAEDRPGPVTEFPGQGNQAKAARRKQAAAQRAKERTAPPPVVEAPPEDEPEFVRSSRLREETGATRRMLMAGGAVVLALLLVLQGVWSFRNVWAARYPGARPALAGVCAVIGCKVELPAQIDALAVETGELQTLDATTFSFTTLLRNQGELVQAWPHLELALTDANDKTLVRRVFAPADYLPPGPLAAKGFAARSEQPVKLFFQLNQIKASGYHLAIFYP